MSTPESAAAKKAMFEKLGELKNAAIAEESIVNDIVTATLDALHESYNYPDQYAAVYAVYAAHDLRDVAKVLSTLADQVETWGEGV